MLTKRLLRTTGQGLVLMVLSTFLILSLFTTARAEKAMDRILSKGKIKVGCIVGVSTKKDPVTSKYTGYGPDAVRYIFDKIKVEVEFVDTAWATFAAGLQSEKFDLSIAETFATIARGSAVAFTRPLIYLGTGAVTLKSSKIRTIGDIKKPGVRISLTQGTSQHRWAVKTFPKAEFVISTAITEVRLMDIITNKADLGFADSAQTYQFAKTYPEAVDLFPNKPLNMMAISWAVKKGKHDLLNFMNTAIGVLHSTGEFNKMMIENGIVPGTRFIPEIVIKPFTGKE